MAVAASGSRPTPRAMQWSSPLLYLAAIVILYVNNAPQNPYQWQVVLQIALVPLVIAAVVLRVRLPYALPLLGIVAMVAGTTSVFLVGMMSLAVRRAGLRIWLVAVLGGTIFSVQNYQRFAAEGSQAGELVLFVMLGFVVIGIAPTLVGRYIRLHRQLESSVAEQAVRAEVDRELASREAAQTERERIAREMHDSVGHVLALLTMQAGALEVSAKDPKVVEAAESIRVTARTGLADLRAVVRALGEEDRRDPAPGLAAVPQLVQASRSAGANVELTWNLDDDGPQPPASLGRVLYRIVQEGLTNAHRHAPGAPVEISLAGSPGAGVELVMANRLTPGGERGAGTGLAALRNRVEVLGGTFDTRAARGQFELRAQLPWEDT